MDRVARCAETGDVRPHGGGPRRRHHRHDRRPFAQHHPVATQTKRARWQLPRGGAQHLEPGRDERGHCVEASREDELAPLLLEPPFAEPDRKDGRRAGAEHERGRLERPHEHARPREHGAEVEGSLDFRGAHVGKARHARSREDPLGATHPATRSAESETDAKTAPVGEHASKLGHTPGGRFAEQSARAVLARLRQLRAGGKGAGEAGPNELFVTSENHTRRLAHFAGRRGASAFAEGRDRAERDDGRAHGTVSRSGS